MIESMLLLRSGKGNTPTTDKKVEIKMTNLDQLVLKIEADNEGVTIDGYGDEWYINREYGQYTIYAREVEDGYELGTYKDMENEDMANEKTVKTLKAVNTFIQKYL